MKEFISESGIEDYIEQLTVNRRAFEQDAQEMVMQYLENESSLFLFQFKSSLEEGNRLVELENLYEFEQGIRTVYAGCRETFAKQRGRLKDSPLEPMVEEALHILEESLGLLPDDPDNPIAVERIRCIAEAIDETKQIYRREMKRYMEEAYDREPILEDAASWLLAMVSSIMQNSLAEVEDIHCKTLLFLNRYDARSHGKAYMHALLTVKDLLEPLLAQEAATVAAAFSEPWQEKFAGQFFHILREIYIRIESMQQQELAYINGIQLSREQIRNHFTALLEVCDNMPPANANPALIRLIEDYFRRKQEVFDRLADRMHEALKLQAAGIIRGIQHNAERLLKMGEALAGAFGQAWEACMEMGADDAVSSGIKETLQIKHKVIEEKNEAYRSLTARRLERSEAALIVLGNDLLKNVRVYFDQRLHHREDAFALTEKQCERLKRELEDIALKQDVAYLAQDLLPEINTFEDLIGGTLEKMAGMEQLQWMVRLLADLSVHIGEISHGAGLEMIDPQAGERFNGREQEVLMVETDADRKKGEIIKVHTKGYRFGRVIVQRAQVIVSG